MNVVNDIIADATVQQMNVSKLSERTGLDRKTISAILNRETENPKVETLGALAAALGGEIVYQTVDSKAAIKAGDITYYRTMISNAQHEIDSKNRWLHLLFWTAVTEAGAFAFFVTILICFLHG